MELKIKLDEKMIAETANRVLDEFKYNGKTIREWADLIANPKTNADKIRTETDDELADWFIKIQDDVADYYDGGHAFAPELPTLKDSWLDWLKQECE